MLALLHTRRSSWLAGGIGLTGTLVLLGGGIAAATLEAPAGRPPAASAPAAATPSPAAPSQEQTEEAIRAAFAEYEAALLGRDGERGTAVISSRVYGFYDGMRQLALTADAQQLGGLRIFEQVTVYALRAEISAELLRTATPRELLGAAIDEGLVSEQAVRNFTLGRITVDGGSAAAEALRLGKASGVEFAFVLEGGQWRLDLQPLIDLGAAGFEALAQEEGIPAAEFVSRLLVVQYGEARAAQLRAPVGR